MVLATAGARVTVTAMNKADQTRLLAVWRGEQGRPSRMSAKFLGAGREKK